VRLCDVGGEKKEHWWMMGLMLQLYVWHHLFGWSKHEGKKLRKGEYKKKFINISGHVWRKDKRWGLGIHTIGAKILGTPEPQM